MREKQESPLNKWALSIISGAFALIVSQYYYLTNKVADLDIRVASAAAQQVVISDQLKNIIANGSVSAQRNEAILSMVIDQVKTMNTTLASYGDKSVVGHVELEARLASKIDAIEKRVEDVSKRGGKGS